ncbi:hypothetical protein [Pleionea sp. CnH1-48]|uniref:hypothetical protein n=1 Tax=Pleionea sp. CnH1-48 TaxID=2954494 RepID=UPI0020974036|nr:hypothetical protein [Pleionea sp. CnH1-48]MCO7223061.1 hypothetical protein [Pleionea sp. CnH1-48]
MFQSFLVFLMSPGGLGFDLAQSLVNDFIGEEVTNISEVNFNDTQFIQSLEEDGATVVYANKGAFAYTYQVRSDWGGMVDYVAVVADMDGDGQPDACRREDRSRVWDCAEKGWFDYSCSSIQNLAERFNVEIECNEPFEVSVWDDARPKIEDMTGISVGDYDNDGLNEIAYTHSGEFHVIDDLIALRQQSNDDVDTLRLQGVYNWHINDDSKLQLSVDFGGWNYDLGYKDGACLYYKGSGLFDIKSCDDVKFVFISHANQKLQMRALEWGGNWNPWGKSGGVCFAYKGAGTYGLIACDDDPGSWVFLDSGKLKYYSNPWGKNGGACLSFSEGAFSFFDCGIDNPHADNPTVGTPPVQPLNYDSLNESERLDAYFAMLIIDTHINAGTEVTLAHFNTNTTSGQFVHKYGLYSVMQLYRSGKIDISGGLNWNI